MKKHLVRVATHPLVSGSFITVIGAMIANVFNYLYNFSLLRLIPSEYGVMAGLIALFNIFAVFSITIVTIFSKFTAMYTARGNDQDVAALLRKGTYYVGVYGFFFSVLLAAFSFPISGFFKIGNPWLVVLIAISLYFTFLSSVANGVLQGLLRFVSLSVIYIAQTILKVIVAVALVLLGFHIFGAVVAFVLSLLFGTLYSYFVLLPHLRNPHLKLLHLPGLRKEIMVFALPVLLSGIGFTLLITIDILLSDHYFPKAVANQYAALSLMGRTIFFIVQPVSSVLFPLLSQKKEKNEDVFGTLIMCLSIIALPIIFLCSIYFLFPAVILRIFGQNHILAQYLGHFSIFIALYTISYFLNTYFLSIGRTRVYLISLGASILEILNIVFFHQSIWQIIYGLIVIAFLQVITLLVYYFHKKPAAYIHEKKP